MGCKISAKTAITVDYLVNQALHDVLREPETLFVNQIIERICQR